MTATIGGTIGTVGGAKNCQMSTRIRVNLLRQFRNSVCNSLRHFLGRLAFTA